MAVRWCSLLGVAVIAYGLNGRLWTREIRENLLRGNANTQCQCCLPCHTALLSRNQSDALYGPTKEQTVLLSHLTIKMTDTPETDQENHSEVTRLLMSLQPCVDCDGRGTVGEIGSYGRPIRITCSNCFGTGKQGGDHIRFANSLLSLTSAD